MKKIFFFKKKQECAVVGAYIATTQRLRDGFYLVGPYQEDPNNSFKIFE